MLTSGERQVAASLDGIRRDHLCRYRFAAQRLQPPLRILDVACGVGYGSRMLAEAGHIVLGIDRDAEAIAFADKHYGSWDLRLAFTCRPLGLQAAMAAVAGQGFDAVVCFETLEHVPEAEARAFLEAMARSVAQLIVSVPNEAVIPYSRTRAPFHFRHYRRSELQRMLEETGWAPQAWWTQMGPHSDLEHLPDGHAGGRTLIAEAATTHTLMAGPVLASSAPAPSLAGVNLQEAIRVRDERADPSPLAVRAQHDAEGRIEIRLTDEQPPEVAKPKGPRRVALLGLGASLDQYLLLAKSAGGRRVFFDEVWTINALGDVLHSDRVFHMDDVRIQQSRSDHRRHTFRLALDKANEDLEAVAKTMADKLLEIGDLEASADEGLAACDLIDIGRRIVALEGQLDRLEAARQEALAMRAACEGELASIDNVGALLVWLKSHPGPVYTSAPHPDYPGMVRFPLDRVLNVTPWAYFNSTVAYAVALAIAEEVEELHLFGIDFSYANVHHAEAGRACVEFWIGVGLARGMRIQAARTSPLLDSNVPRDRKMYGFDIVKPRQHGDLAGQITVAYDELPPEQWPTGEAIEDRYDHSRHPQADNPAGTAAAP